MLIVGTIVPASDPLKGDFVHYTIPRLQERGEAGPGYRLTATANIYKRIIELGYTTEDNLELTDKKDSEFYYGSKPYGFEGKVDRLGKNILGWHFLIMLDIY